jgi:hypothetical protein
LESNVMTISTRRHVLFSGAVFAAAASLVAAAPSTRANSAELLPDHRAWVVRWDAAASQWPKRPAGAAYGVIFLSTNDPAAPAPSDPTQMVGDEWHRHPGSMAA